MEKDEFPIQSYTQKELAGHYRVSPKTLKRWLKRLKLDLGTRIGNSFSPRQVKIIVDSLGKPFSWIAIMWAKWMMGDPDPDHDGLDGGEGKLG